MDILFNVMQAFVMGLIAFAITHWGYTHNINVLLLQGRINRLQFLIGLIGLTLIVSLFNTLISLLMSNVVILVSYWAIRLLAFLGHTITLALYYVLYTRRVQDFSIHGIVGILWCLFIAFTYPYLPIKSTSAAFMVIIWIVNLLLLVIPGTAKTNRYGTPPLWPKKESKKVVRKKNNLTYN